jgi:hypothetical protein
MEALLTESITLLFTLDVILLRGMRIGYWWGNQKERDHWEDQDLGG